jgi:PKD repeat protein
MKTKKFLGFIVLLIFELAINGCGEPEPMADFSFSPSTAEIGTKVTFNNHSTNAIKFLWDFGDGTTSTEENPTHIFYNDGIHSISLTATGDGGTNSTSKTIEISLPLCGDGSGYPVTFCKQVANYQYGYGEKDKDVIVVECLVGPKNATVSNQENGTYYCAGTYKLSTFENAEIGINWGGRTTYSMYQECSVSRGDGAFSIKVDKTSGGSGNIYLTMSSDWHWMFDIVLINTNCDTHKSVKINPTSNRIPEIIQDEHNKKVINCEQIYDLNLFSN